MAKKKETKKTLYVKCPVFKKMYEVDNEKKICPCCGEVHPEECYIEEG